MGFIIMAKGEQTIFFCSELAWTLVSVVLAWFCVRFFGLNGAGIAFFGSYVVHGFLLYWIVKRLSGFRWSTANKQTGLFFLTSIAVVFCAFYVLPLLWASCLGAVAALLCGAYSLRVLFTLISWNQIPRPIRRLLLGFGYSPSGL